MLCCDWLKIGQIKPCVVIGGKSPKLNPVMIGKKLDNLMCCDW